MGDTAICFHGHPFPLASPFLMPAHIAGILRASCHHENPEVEEEKEAPET